MKEICYGMEAIGLAIAEIMIVMFTFFLVLFLIGLKIFVRVGWFLAFVVILLIPQSGLLLLAVWCMLVLATWGWLC